MSFALDVLLFSTAWMHVLLAPYTKVEESFNLHATHDVLMYGVHPNNIQNYDHFVFPGAVPRSFLGSLILAGLSTPYIYLAEGMGLVSSKFDLQIIIRLVLASVNVAGLCLLQRAVTHRFGRPTGFFFALLSVSQFHLPFWMGRTLPNMLALFPANLAWYAFLNRGPNATRPSERGVHTAIALLTFTAVVLRAEVLLLLAPLVLQSLVRGYTSFTSVLKIGIFSGALSLGLTVLVDSYFWNQWPLWPEFAGIYFNIYEGKASEWGIAPWHTYFTSSLPKLLLASLPLSILGAILDFRVRSLLFVPAAFVAAMSLLGHKEWRFVVYTVPLFNVAAARGVRWMMGLRKSSFLGRLAFLSVIGMLAANVLVTYVFTLTSVANYPGGVAMTYLNEQYRDGSSVHVHVSNLAAQTGASLFLHAYSPPYFHFSSSTTDLIPVKHDWTYNKTELLSPSDLSAPSSEYTHLITEYPPSEFDAKRWDVKGAVKAFERWDVDWGKVKGLSELNESVRMVETERLWVLERV